MNTWEWIREHSTLVLLLVGGLLVGILFLRKQPPTAYAPALSADLSGLTTDASGRPIVYRAVSDTFITQNITGSYNQAAPDGSVTVGNLAPTTTTTSTSTSTTTTTDNHSTPIEHPIEPTPQHTATIRQRVGSLGDPAGVPLRLSPGTVLVVRVPYGVTVTLTGPGVNGPNNNPVSGGPGSYLWYPASYLGKSGFLSAYDIANIS